MRRQERRRQEALIKETASKNSEKIVDENVSNSMAGKSDKDTEKLDKPSADPEEPTCEATAYIPQVKSDNTVKKAAAETSNTDHHTEKFKCDHCNYKNSSERG